MQIWIDRPKVYLPARLQHELDKKQQQEAWRRRYFTTAVSVLVIVVLNLAGLKVALNGGGEWAAVPMLMSALPVLWLFDKAVFGAAPNSSESNS